MLRQPCRKAVAAAAVLAAFVLMAAADVAQAHRLNLFATAEGDAIGGRAYFPGGGKAKNVKVEVLGPSGEKLGETATDEEGRFAFKAAFRCDHTFVAETADGHRASYTIGAGELPQGLPPLGAEPALPTEANGHDETTGEAPQEATPGTPSMQPPAGPAISPDELQAAVETAVARQLQPLREQLEGYESKVRLHDVLAGIGYIFGVSGVAFYFLGRSRKGAGRAREQ